MNFSKLIWTDHPSNPLIEPPRPEWMIADPTVLMPSESPDGRWHLLANSVWGIHHHTSDDGISWQRGKRLFPGIRSFIMKHEGRYFVFNETFIKPFVTAVVMRVSDDLIEWSDPKTILQPCFDWHNAHYKACGNPCIVKWKNEYLLFYSASVIFLKDCLFFEPRHIGIARASSLTGPYTPDPEPIFSPEPDHPYRNFGAGAIKVVADEQNDILWGFNNGIYHDNKGRSRSCIMLLKSSDAVNWTQVHDEPIVKPEPGWKRALVYAVDIKQDADRAYLYYNARDGWFIGSERIGLAIGTPG
ncbi:MAG: glycosyl hydrolase family 43 [bacterium]